MDLTASSISLMMNVLVLMLTVHYGLSQTSERTFPRIVPSQLQFIYYTSVTVTCEGFFNNLIKWRVLRRKGKGNLETACNKEISTSGMCHIPMVYPADSGEYWCESEDRRRSESVQITVSENVILESPVLPVMVGDNVTLRCITNTNLEPSTKFDFYKDGVRVDTSSSGELTLYNISLSDQGLYKCNISENEFSTENWLQVKAVLLECPDQPVMEGEKVTLFCRDKMAAANYTSFFYKDDEMIGNSSSGKLTLNRVSKMDEGVYKCQTSEDRESEEQWLAVRGSTEQGARQSPGMRREEQRREQGTAKTGTKTAPGTEPEEAEPGRTGEREPEQETWSRQGPGRDKEVKVGVDCTGAGARSREQNQRSGAGGVRRTGTWEAANSKHTLPRIVPSRLQFFYYTSLTVTCEGFFNDLIKWRVVRRKGKGNQKTTCNKESSTSGTCHIEMLFPSDAGEYWCESEDRKRSESVRITVSENVILESPVRPVMVGDNVTLRCLKNPNLKPSTKFDFYKDGVRVDTSSSGELTLYNISLCALGVS
ncbi:neural cell adhesion molecule 2-like [Periophthalmus magnuspinnatus]|uniref:neural cell adhesion molecule 2-like n=1 Tax=Periophthalmus magnuspinnatus TaxID=409849 RepID=UPI0024374635|nr:neural cell adhesion molecule 2-like [Periophthalmus magnuspinnatus]